MTLYESKIYNNKSALIPQVRFPNFV